MKKEGSILGGTLLISGSCIGAGMLALPVITLSAGFLPSIFFFFLAWIFMMMTGFLLLEVNLTLGYRFSLISLAHKTLGSYGKMLCWALFLFLFYSLNVAYISASGSILYSILAIPPATSSVLFCLLCGFVLFLGVKPVDYLNRLLMLGLIVCYFLLVFLGSRHIDFDQLRHHEWKYAFVCMPVMILSFGFHNMIPTLASYMKGDVRRLKITFFLGSLLPFLIYFLWEVMMLGILDRGAISDGVGSEEIATSALAAVLGKGWIVTVGQLFALFAIITSFLAQSFSLVDFLADGLTMARVGIRRLFLIFITIVPPLCFALRSPGIFIKALNLAGGLSAVILFGVMPALMVWVLRHNQKREMVTVLPGSKILLATVLIIALSVFFIEVSEEVGLRILPHAQ